MSTPHPLHLETDPRFPSGRWVGFFLQPQIPGKHPMELLLQFHNGEMKGEGRDFVGLFTVTGRYTLEDGHCHWHKRYQGKHDVFYRGFNEGKGIWGTWEIAKSASQSALRGGFHIWPEEMNDPTQNNLVEEAEPPIGITEYEEEESPLAVPV